MKRIIIIGNSGSGKSYLAQRLSDHFGYPLIHLDILFWEPGGFNLKRPKEIVYAEIARLVQGESWIVEGVFGELAREFFTSADYFIWLDLDWEACLNSLSQRGSESSQQLDQQSAEENFKKLVKWASAYWEREGPRSWRGHQMLFEEFSLEKIHLKSREAVNDFAASIIGRELAARSIVTTNSVTEKRL
jgi:adenylate kinase family enzyme